MQGQTITTLPFDFKPNYAKKVQFIIIIFEEKWNQGK